MSPVPRAGLAALLLLAACDSGTEDRRDVSATRAVMRPHVPVPPGAVPRGAGAQAAALAAPGPEATPALVARGRERFLAFCSPCHGASGRGDGVVTTRGFPRPPSYFDERLKAAPPDHIVGVITNGKGAMYPYAERVPPEDRWAIAHYVKALQAGVAP
ncbi:MAG TPA: cytochrome c [Microvirga sp.]|jgi:mono/diheme cytochrome c family protein|nr:cytochrome c [Microvirga sp.]